MFDETAHRGAWRRPSRGGSSRTRSCPAVPSGWVIMIGIDDPENQGQRMRSRVHMQVNIRTSVVQLLEGNGRHYTNPVMILQDDRIIQNSFLSCNPIRMSTYDKYSGTIKFTTNMLVLRSREPTSKDEGSNLRLRLSYHSTLGSRVIKKERKGNNWRGIKDVCLTSPAIPSGWIMLMNTQPHENY